MLPLRSEGILMTVFFWKQNMKLSYTRRLLIEIEILHRWRPQREGHRRHRRCPSRRRPSPADQRGWGTQSSAA
jgi:hypothetical protein